MCKFSLELCISSSMLPICMQQKPVSSQFIGEFHGNYFKILRIKRPESKISCLMNSKDYLKRCTTFCQLYCGSPLSYQVRSSSTVPWVSDNIKLEKTKDKIVEIMDHNVFDQGGLLQVIDLFMQCITITL